MRQCGTRSSSVLDRVTALVATLAVVAACGASVTPGSSTPEGPTRSAAPPGSSSAGAAPTTALASAKEILDAARTADGAPGAIALIRHGPARRWVASGTADTVGTPIDESTRFRIASITKPIVAALVLDAVARGEVDLDAIVGDLLPGTIRSDPRVTVRQLLDHSSGIYDESNGASSVDQVRTDITKLADPALRAEASSVLEKVLAGQPAIASDRVLVGLSETHDRLFEPGTGWAYSNTNYQLAAMVLQQATGRSVSDLLRDRIVGPLGLSRTTIAPPDTASPELRGYDTADDGSLVDATDDLGWFGNGGNGGIISTPDELLTTIQAIVGGRLLPASLTSEMLRTNSAGYGLGIGIGTYSCGTVFGHQGAVNGTLSIAEVSPDGTDGVVVVLDHRGQEDPDLPALADRLLCATQ